MKQRLLELIELSEDVYYDQYLKQMLRDLESGKATPGQVKKEADRTYRLYLERVSKGQTARKTSVTETGKVTQRPATEHAVQVPKTEKTLQVPKAKKTPDSAQVKNAVEFKIGAGIFSIVGGVFVLAALVIFGFHFLEGIGQGICLYAVSLAVFLLSELLLQKLNQKIAVVITGIGIGSLYISTVINYLVLKNINGIAASLLTAVIALLAVFVSRKREAASIRLISVLGCYISFLPVGGFESEASFVVVTVMLFLLNIVSVFFPNQKNRAVIGTVHMIVHTLFCGIVTAVMLRSDMEMIYGTFFLILSLLFLNIVYLRQKEEMLLYDMVSFSVCLGFFVIFMVCFGCQDSDFYSEGFALFGKLLTEITALAVALVFYILWGKDRRRWIQFYFMSAVIVLFNGFSHYKIETTVGILTAFFIVKLLSKEKELTVLDCILSVVTALQGIYMTRSVYVLPFVLIILCSVFFIRRMAIFHEVVITLFFLIGMVAQFDSDWTLPGCLFLLLLLFLLFNHLPVLKQKKQLPYNITNTVLAVVLCLSSWFCKDILIHAAVMAIGTIIILVTLRERYGMKLPKKYLILAGFLAYMILTMRFEASVLVSSLLMVIALGCVGIGFRLKDKAYRLCGLVVAILVCVKLVVYDFRELTALSKAALFLIVGLLALFISFLYLFLEKKESRTEKACGEIKELRKKEISAEGKDSHKEEISAEVKDSYKEETSAEVKDSRKEEPYTEAKDTLEKETDTEIKEAHGEEVNAAD